MSMMNKQMMTIVSVFMIIERIYETLYIVILLIYTIYIIYMFWNRIKRKYMSMKHRQ